MIHLWWLIFSNILWLWILTTYNPWGDPPSTDQKMDWRPRRSEFLRPGLPGTTPSKKQAHQDWWSRKVIVIVFYGPFAAHLPPLVVIRMLSLVTFYPNSDTLAMRRIPRMNRAFCTFQLSDFFPAIGSSAILHFRMCRRNSSIRPWGGMDLACPNESQFAELDVHEYVRILLCVLMLTQNFWMYLDLSGNLLHSWGGL